MYYNVVKILVDDLVENNQMYKDSVSSIINYVNNACKNIDGKGHDECELSNYTSQDVIDKFSTAYVDARNTGCEETCEKTNDCTTNCNTINDKNLLRALNEGRHIVLETTGGRIPAWVLSTNFKELLEANRYIVVVSYSLVNVEKLKSRNLGRLTSSMQNFKANDNGPAPRLPDIRKLDDAVKAMKEVLNNLYILCINNGNSNEKTCGEYSMNRLLIFNNNNDNNDMILVFDSTITDKSTFKSVIDNALTPSPTNGGRTAKRRSNKRRTNKRRTAKRRTKHNKK